MQKLTPVVLLCLWSKMCKHKEYHEAVKFFPKWFKYLNIFKILRLVSLDRGQEGKVKGPEFTSSHETLKITTNCWKTSNREDWNLSKKYYTSKNKKTHHNKMVVGRAHLQNNQISYLPVGWSTNWKIIRPQRFSHRHDSSEPRIGLLSPGAWYWEEGPPEPFGFEG